ncbi:hypothetical protein Tco_0322732 [Tanacetum coccineum]
MLAPKCSTYNGRPTFANPRYLKKAQSEKPCLYEIPYDTSDLANRFAPNREETMTLANESRSKLNKDYVKPYDYTKQNSLYEIFKAPSLEYLYQLERAKEVRKTMWRKPFVRTKPNIAKNVAFLPVSKSISKSRQVFNDMTFNINQFREIVDQAWFKHTSDYFRVPTAKDMEVLIKTLLMPLSIKSQNDSFRFEHELKTEMHEDYEYVKSLEKEVDELESEKADFSNIYDLLLEECVSKDVICSYLHSLSDLTAYTELKCMYLHKVKECECLAQKLLKQTESVNKEVHNKLLKSFAKLENHSISLELALQQCKEQMKNNSVCKENGSNVFRKEREQYHEIQDLKAQMQDKNIAISELKKLIEKCKGKSVETQFDKPSVVRQPNAQRILKPSVLGKPTPFSNSPEMRSFQTKQSVNKTNVSDGLFKQVTQQNLPQNRKQAEIHSNVLKPGMYRIATTTTQTRTPQLPHASRNTNPHVSKSTGVNHYTSVSRPQLKSYQVKDKVVPNNSQVKFNHKEVEEHHRISSIFRKTKSVTACNDSSKSRTLNVNAVCAECGKCVFNSNHDACVSRYLNDVNARTKKPKDLICPMFHRPLIPLADVTTILSLLTLGCHKAHDGNPQAGYVDISGNIYKAGKRGYDSTQYLVQETTSSTPIGFIAKASHNSSRVYASMTFSTYCDYITLLSKKHIVDRLYLKLKYVPRINFVRLVEMIKQKELTLRVLEQIPMLIFKKKALNIRNSTPRTPEQNGVVVR